MIKLYVSRSCRSCLKAKNWLEKHNIPYIEKNILTQKLSKKEIKDILMKTENGTEDIISPGSTIIRKMRNEGFNFDNMLTEEFVNFIQENPNALRRPILIEIEGQKLLVGYDEDDIEIFVKR